MNIFFDMDQTLLGLDETLRPKAREVMQRLKDDGHTLYVWSGMGIRWAEVHSHKLDELITDCFIKPTYNYAQATKEAGLPVMPDLVIDDIPEVSRALGGAWVEPYRFHFHSPDDNDMERVYQIITDYAQNGHSADDRFYPAPDRSNIS